MVASLSDFQDQFVDHLLVQFREKPNAINYVREWATRQHTLQTVIEQVQDLFDLENIGGVNLEIVGAYVDVQREGVDDPTLRKKIQSKIFQVIGSNGTIDTLIALAQIWGAGQPAVFTEVYPREFALAVDQISDGDRMILREFIRAAKLGGVRWQLHTTEDPGLYCDSVSDPLDVVGILDSITSPITGAEVLSVMDE